MVELPLNSFERACNGYLDDALFLTEAQPPYQKKRGQEEGKSQIVGGSQRTKALGDFRQ